MKKLPVLLKSECLLLTLALAGFFCISPPPVRAQSTPAQATKPAQERSSDINYGQLLNFDNFLDKHPELAEQLRKNPSLVRDDDFVNSHSALRDYLRDHPDVREEIRENPEVFMRAENRVDRLEGRGDRGDITRGELRSFDNFLDRHREISEQLHKNPSLVNNEQFLKDHPALRDFLQAHQGVREEIRENPTIFMQAENRFDRTEDIRDRDSSDITRGELRSFDNFLDRHREISDQLRQNPSLVNDQQFLNDHPALREFLQNHPGVREEIRENPDVFMRAESRFDRREDNLDRRNGDRDADRTSNRSDITRGELRSFDNFLDRHREISEQLHKNPSLVNNEQFLKDHPALRDFLQAHQGVREEIRENPDVFMQAENRLDQHEGSLNRRDDDFDRDRRTGEMDRDTFERSHMHRNFGAFMNSHSELAEQLARDPDQVKNEEFLKSHPELKEYLSAHPRDRQALMADPHAFIKNSQKFANSGNQAAKPPAIKPKPNQ